MDQISLSLNKDSLLSFFKDFHTLTEIKIALFSEDGKEILSYPDSHCPACSVIRSTEEGNKECEACNEQSFIRCQSSKKIDIYHCHAGLIEATAPLIENGVVIGYIMFGQITDDPDKKDLVAYKSTEQIHATAKLLEACTLYVLLSNMISLRSENFINNLNQFLMSHLSEDLSVDRLTREFIISKNKLYDTCSRYMSTGIAEHIKNLRIDEAKKLLVETDLSVQQIADQVGFSDYNYFCRIFKKEVGMPARSYRKNVRV